MTKTSIAGGAHYILIVPLPFFFFCRPTKGNQAAMQLRSKDAEVFEFLV
jgi:hypothetical protein